MTQAHPLPHRRLFYGILVAFVVLALTYSASVPIFETPDELFHYPMIQHIATEQALPVLPTDPHADVGPWKQEGAQPPLYYLLAALLTAPINTADLAQVRHLNPQAARGVATADRNNLNVVIHDPARERFPWRGSVLAIHVARLLSVAYGAVAVVASWHLLQALFPRRPNVALAATATHAFTPMFVFISSAVNNDALIIPLSIISMLTMVHIIQARQLSVTRFALLGLVLGLAALTKASGLVLLPLAFATTVWTCWHPPEGTFTRRAGQLIKRTLTWLLPFLLITGWWYVRNLRLYGDLLGLNAFLAVIGQRTHALSLAALWQERTSFLTSYWGNFGWLNVLMPEAIYTTLNAVTAAAGLGLLWRFAQWLREEKPLWKRLWPFYWPPLTAARALAWAWPVAVFVALIRWTCMTMASQGRLVFPALPLWSLGLVWGLLTWVPPQRVRLTRATIVAIPTVLLTLTVIALPAWILPSYRPPAPLPETFTAPNPLNVTFGQHLRLLGYRIDTDIVTPGDYAKFDLYWESLTPTETEHLLFIHLLGEGDRIVAQRDTLPGRGLLSTTQLTPGRTWTEHLAIRIPPQAYAPDELTVSVGVYDATTGARLQTPNGADQMRFEEIALQAQESNVPNPVQIRFGAGMRLRGYDVSALTVAPGAPLTVTLHWEGIAPMPTDYTVSVQLIDAQWRKAAQSDAWPQDGAAPTSTWRKGQTLEETRVLTVAEDAAPGVYDLRLDVYTVQEGQIEHLPVRQERNQTAETHIILTRLRVGAW
jgi:hypothetical protein